MKRLSKALLAAAALAAGCSDSGIRGDGSIAAESRPIADVTALDISGGYEVTWTNGSPSLTVTADRNLLPHVKSVVSGRTLKIGSEGRLRPTRTMRIALSGSSLRDVALTGGISLTAGTLDAQQLAVTATGASDIRLNGAATNLVVTLTGASKLHARGLQAGAATLTLTGASDADISVSESLRVSLTGAGSVTYSGSPKKVDKTISGAGTIRQRQ